MGVLTRKDTAEYSKMLVFRCRPSTEEVKGWSVEHLKQYLVGNRFVQYEKIKSTSRPSAQSGKFTIVES